MQIADLSFTLEEDEIEQVNPQYCLRCFNNCSSSTSKLEQLNSNLDSDGSSEAHLASFLFCTTSSMTHDWQGMTSCVTLFAAGFDAHLHEPSS